MVPRTAIFHLLFVCQFNHLYYWCKDFEQSISTQTQWLISCLVNPVDMVTDLYGHRCGYRKKPWAILIFINLCLTVDFSCTSCTAKAAERRYTQDVNINSIHFSLL